jgi:tripartite-type tricarboxylate transporter receptor subunit TctC
MTGLVSLPRRRFLRLASAAAILPVTRARAQAYPSQPIRFVVGFPPGGGADIVSRIMAAWLSERLGQQVFVENKPGASTNLSLQTVVNAPPDGYTIVFIAASATVNVSLFKNLSFDLVHDIAPVAGLVDFPLVLLATPSLPVKTVAELIAYAKANPGKVNMASAGSGTAPHVFGELFKTMTGVDLTHVPYRGSFYPDLLAGQVQVAFTAIAGSLAFIKAGKLRALAVTTARPATQLPHEPPLNKFVPGYEASAWLGIGAPNGTPVEIVDKLNNEINASLNDPNNKARLAALGVEPSPMSPTVLEKFTADETQKWAKVIAAAHVKAE